MTTVPGASVRKAQFADGLYIFERTMFTQKFVAMGSLPTVKELKTLIQGSNGSARDYLAAWPSVRCRVLSEVVPGRLQSLEKALETQKHGLVSEIEALVDAIRRSTRLIGTRPWPKGKQQELLVREYLYFKHSSAVLGRGKGISSSALERQFGMELEDCYVR